MVKVSKKPCAKIPDNVSDESASFAVVASIGLQGIRLAQPTLGESFVVTGVDFDWLTLHHPDAKSKRLSCSRH